jgi:hypothetical protein
VRLFDALLPLDELRVDAAREVDAPRLDEDRAPTDLDADALPFVDAFALLAGADFEPLDDEDEALDDAEVRPDEGEALLEVEAPERLEEDLLEAAFLLPPELELVRLPADFVEDEERPDEARPEDWLRDFFIVIGFTMMTSLLSFFLI